jgi:hypothetical protein
MNVVHASNAFAIQANDQIALPDTCRLRGAILLD